MSKWERGAVNRAVYGVDVATLCPFPETRRISNDSIISPLVDQRFRNMDVPREEQATFLPGDL